MSKIPVEINENIWNVNKMPNMGKTMLQQKVALSQDASLLVPIDDLPLVDGINGWSDKINPYKPETMINLSDTLLGTALYVPTVTYLNDVVKSKKNKSDKEKVIVENGNNKTINGANINGGIGHVIAYSNRPISFTAGIGKTSAGYVQNAYVLRSIDEESLAANYYNSLYGRRDQGDVQLVGNFELGYCGPLDARTVTSSRYTLVDPLWWITSAEKPVYIYRGMIVAIKASQELVMYNGADVIISDASQTAYDALKDDKWVLLSVNRQGGSQSLDDGNPIEIKTTRIDEPYNDRGTVNYNSSINVHPGKISLQAIYDPDLNPPVADTSAAIFIDASLHTSNVSIIVEDEFKGPVYQSSWDINKGFTTAGIVYDVSKTAPYKNRFKNKSAETKIRLNTNGIQLDSSAKILKKLNPDDPANKAKFIYEGKYNITVTPEQLILNGLERSNSSTNKGRVYSNITMKNGNITANTRKSIAVNTSDGMFVSVANEHANIAGSYTLNATGYNTASNVAFVNNLNWTLPDTDKLINDPSTTTDPSTDIPDISVDSSAVKLSGNWSFDGVVSDSKFIDSSANINTKKIQLSQGAQSYLNKTSNYRVDENVVSSFLSELKNGNICTIDLTDTDNLNEPAYVLHRYSNDNNASIGKYDSSLFKFVQSSSDNTPSELWINDNIDTSSSELKADIDKLVLSNYAVANVSSSQFNEDAIAVFSSLLNTGTVTIKSFGDISINSIAGAIKLGTDGFTKLTQNKVLSVRPNENTYFKVGQKGITLNSSAISLWNNIQFEQPDKDNQVPVYRDGKIEWETSDFTYTVYNGTHKRGIFQIAEGTLSVTTSPGVHAYDMNSIELNLISSAYKGTIKIDGILYNPKTAAENGAKSCITITDNTTSLSGGPIHIINEFDDKDNRDLRAFTKTNAYQTNAIDADVYTANTVSKTATYNTPGEQQTAIATQLGATSVVSKWNQSTLATTVSTVTPRVATTNTITALNNCDKSPIIIQVSQKLKGENEPNYNPPPFNILVEIFVVVPPKEMVSFATDNIVGKWVIDSNRTSQEEENEALNNSNYKGHNDIHNDDLSISHYYDTFIIGANNKATTLIPILYSKNVNAVPSLVANSSLEEETKLTDYYLKVDSNSGNMSWVHSTQIPNNIKYSQIKNNSSVVSKYYPLTSDSSLPESEQELKDTLKVHDKVYFDQHGDFYATNYYSSSDETLKTEIAPVKIKYDQVIIGVNAVTGEHIYRYDKKELPPIKQFKWKDNPEKLQYGFIAQELEENYKDLVIEDNGIKRVNYNSAFAYLISDLYETIEKMQETIKSLRTEINNLKNN